MSRHNEFGRVDDDGTVYVRTSEGERAVGQWPEGDPAAALAFYERRFDGHAVEVDLLERRIRSGAVMPDDAAAAVSKLKASVAQAQAVGDLASLTARLDALGPLIEQRREVRRAERATESRQARAAKEQIAEQAEKLAAGSDWRDGAHRLRELLDSWKALPRIDRASDDGLWHRFSSARTTYTRRRKQHFSELNDRRDRSRAAKEELVTEAETLSTSTEWGATTRAYRDLMTRWKAAGGAKKEVDDALWMRFRAAQEKFFGARDTTSAQLDSEYQRNGEVKREILAEAERLLPVHDAKVTLDAFRQIADRWDAAGKVPRADVQDLEARFKAVEESIRGAEDARWHSASPEAQARAADTVAQLEASITTLETQRAAAQSRGDDSRAARAQADIDTRQSWLTEARKTLREFTPLSVEPSKYSG